MAFLPLGSSDHIIVSVSVDFPYSSKVGAPFHCTAFDYSCDDRNGFLAHIRDGLREDIFNQVLLLLPLNLVDLEVFSFFCTNRTNPQCLRPSSSAPVMDAEGFLNLSKLLLLMKQGSLSPSRNLIYVTLQDHRWYSQQGLLVIPFLVSFPKILSFKAKLFGESFSRKSNFVQYY